MIDAMPYRIDIYIGSDNTSRRIYSDYLSKIEKWANGNFPDGYTLIRGQGCYRGISEDAILINALANIDMNLAGSLVKLKKDLGQEAILLTKAQVDLEVV